MPRLLSVILIAVAAWGAPPDPVKAGMYPDRLARIAVSMKGFVDSGEIAGAVTLVQRHGFLAELGCDPDDRRKVAEDPSPEGNLTPFAGTAE